MRYLLLSFSLLISSLCFAQMMPGGMGGMGGMGGGMPGGGGQGGGQGGGGAVMEPKSATQQNLEQRQEEKLRNWQQDFDKSINKILKLKKKMDKNEEKVAKYQNKKQEALADDNDRKIEKIKSKIEKKEGKNEDLEQELNEWMELKNRVQDSIKKMSRRD